MNTQEILEFLKAIPWQEGIPYALAALDGIEQAATNPLEKAVVAQMITYLKSIQPPA